MRARRRTGARRATTIERAGSQPADRGVTADTALRLAKLLKTTPKFWMSLQASFDLYHAKRALKSA